jgi:hypothetical protein
MFVSFADVSESSHHQGSRRQTSCGHHAGAADSGGGGSDPFLAAISQHFMSGWFQLQPSSVPRLYLGEMQVRDIIGAVRQPVSHGCSLWLAAVAQLSRIPIAAVAHLRVGYQLLMLYS